MKFDTAATQTIRAYLDDPTDSRALYGLGSLYWNLLISTIGQIIHDEGDIHEFLRTEKDFINAGIVETILEDADDIRSQIASGTVAYRYLKVRTVTDWLKDTFHKITAGDKKELLERDIKNLKIEQKKIDKEIASLQQARKELLQKTLGDADDKNVISQINGLVNTDYLTFQNLQTKKEIAKGTFFSVENRREFVAQTNLLQKENEKKDVLFSKVKSSEDKAALRKYNSRINELFDKSITCADTVVKKENEIDTIERDQSVLSPLEVENRVRAELEYLRDMMKLSAKRLHMESCPILRPRQKFFIIKELTACMDRILEFDPRVFYNERVPIFGKPSILLAPGNGYGLYDWKNNRLIIPVSPPTGDFMASIATAIIEYRLDVDDDKNLLTSYQKLPQYKAIRSMVALRANLTRDYIKWMTSEYQGFKVLEKEVRNWFEHEIAPSKIDIYCPPEYQQFELSTEQFQKLLKKIESKLEKESASPSHNDLWAASILNYQQGNFKKSLQYINDLISVDPNHIFSYYNLGIIAMKIPQKQMAIKGFNEFIARRPQSWWAAIARDHARRLKIG
jgi:tetratricopeptide (TPR) repeat protein